MLRAGAGLDVRPHPHIGLATVTYLFDGEILHRDSLGTVQPIRPGEVELDDRRPRHRPFRAHAARRCARPASAALRHPDLGRVAAATTRRPSRRSRITLPTLPLLEGDGKRVRLIVGSLYGVPGAGRGVLGDVLCRRGALAPARGFRFPAEHEERAVYIAEGRIESGRRPLRGRPARWCCGPASRS